MAEITDLVPDTSSDEMQGLMLEISNSFASMPALLRKHAVESLTNWMKTRMPEA